MHQLDMSNGRANIAYAASGGVPWHGMGHSVIDPNQPIEDWAIQAGMDFDVCRVPSGFMIGNEFKPDGKFTLVRDDTLAPLGTFSERYQIVQPIDILHFFRDFILTDERFALETAGCLKGGAVVWGLAKFNETRQVMGEAHESYVFLATSFDGSLATTAQATDIRVVCRNTVQASLYSKNAATVKIRHNQKWNDATKTRAHEQLEKLAGNFSRYTELAESLAQIRMARHQAEAFFKTLLNSDEEDKNKAKANRVEALIASYEETLKEGTEKGSAWTVFNAVTRYVDHGSAVRKVKNEADERDKRMASSFFGPGYNMKAQALDMLQAA